MSDFTILHNVEVYRNHIECPGDFLKSSKNIMQQHKYSYKNLFNPNANLMKYIE